MSGAFKSLWSEFKDIGLKESPKLPTHIYDVLMCTLIKRINVHSSHVKNNILMS